MFGKCDKWMIWKHDVYGNNFQQLYSQHEIMATNHVLQQVKRVGV